MFKAAILEKLNEPLTVDYISNDPLGVGQVLVKIFVSGICGKQLGEISGHYGEDKFLPHLLGHEGSGEVIAIGDGVKNVKVGDHVVMHWRKGAGIESSFPRYNRKTFGDVGGGLVTTFSTYSVVSENRLTVVPKELPHDVAALLGCALTTGLGIVNNEAELKMGQPIAVFGCGGVGLNVILGATMVSAFPIIGIDRDENKLRTAVRCGATHTINTEIGIQNTIFKGMVKVDCFVECTGMSENINLACKLTKPNGKVILVGQVGVGKDLVIKNMSNHYDGKKIFSSQGGLTNPSVDIPRYANLYLAGLLKLDAFLHSSQTFSLDDINLALDVAKSGGASKVFIEMEGV